MYQDPDSGLDFASMRDYRRYQFRQGILRGSILPIDGFSRYMISVYGEIFNRDRARQVKPFFNGHHLAVSLINDEGRRKTMSLARLVAIRFIPQPDQDQYYDVVFKDGDIRNVDPSNLEWQPRWKRHADPANYDIDLG